MHSFHFIAQAAPSSQIQTGLWPAGSPETPVEVLAPSRTIAESTAVRLMGNAGDDWMFIVRLIAIHPAPEPTIVNVNCKGNRN